MKHLASSDFFLATHSAATSFYLALTVVLIILIPKCLTKVWTGKISYTLPDKFSGLLRSNQILCILVVFIRTYVSKTYPNTEPDDLPDQWITGSHRLINELILLYNKILIINKNLETKVWYFIKNFKNINNILDMYRFYV